MVFVKDLFSNLPLQDNPPVVEHHNLGKPYLQNGVFPVTILKQLIYSASTSDRGEVRCVTAPSSRPFVDPFVEGLETDCWPLATNRLRGKLKVRI